MVVRGFHCGGLGRDQIARGRIEVLMLERLSVRGNGRVFPALGLFQHRLRLVGGEGGLQVDPAAMHASGDATRLLDIGAQRRDVSLKPGGKFGALFRVALENLRQLRGFYVLCRGLETVLTIFEDFGQVVESFNRDVNRGIHDVMYLGTTVGQRRPWRGGSSWQGSE